MITHRNSIYVFSFLSLYSFILSIGVTIKFFDKSLSWYQGMCFAILGSSLISLFSSVITYRNEKRECCEKIANEILNMSNNAYTNLYHSTNEYTMEKLANTIGSCCKSCFDILYMLKYYRNGLFCLSNEMKDVTEFMLYLTDDLGVRYTAIGTLLKEEKINVKNNIDNFYNEIDRLLQDNNIIIKINKLLVKNKSTMFIYSNKLNPHLEKTILNYKETLFNHEDQTKVD